jgi:hypothetical protein
MLKECWCDVRPMISHPCLTMTTNNDMYNHSQLWDQTKLTRRYMPDYNLLLLQCFFPLYTQRFFIFIRGWHTSKLCLVFHPPYYYFFNLLQFFTIQFLGPCCIYIYIFIYIYLCHHNLTDSYSKEHLLIQE